MSNIFTIGMKMNQDIITNSLDKQTRYKIKTDNQIKDLKTFFINFKTKNFIFVVKGSTVKTFRDNA